jgi:hypothetical protein
MSVVTLALRYITYIFHGLLALFLAALGGLALASSGPLHLKLDMLPWTDAALPYWLFFGALAGLVILVMAFLGKLRWLFAVWCALVTILMIRGYLFSGYRFAPGDFKTAEYMMGLALLSLPGAWLQWRQMANRVG